MNHHAKIPLIAIYDIEGEKNQIDASISYLFNNIFMEQGQSIYCTSF